GHVCTRTYESTKLALCRDARTPPRLEPAPLTVGALDARFAMKWATLAHAFEELARILLGVVRVHQHLPATPCHVLAIDAEKLAEGPVDELLFAGGIVDPDYQRQPVGHFSEA